MPKQAGYVSIDSRKAGSHDETWFCWSVGCMNNVERQLYTWPTCKLQKPDEYSNDYDDSLSQDNQCSMEPVTRSVDSATDGSPTGDDPPHL
ncbi:hypothetical protein PHMEG_00019632 [Phytophthora megakarya]|uniref:Uncharacterized protein n=1 Tax=Phytophthora megakarya TaxID=4795 RepID=A0A225VRE5_9STRA|nr:hypothetical protein PHMEG_00019632 [Phytophthora megakarya]